MCDKKNLNNKYLLLEVISGGNVYKNINWSPIHNFNFRPHHNLYTFDVFKETNKQQVKRIFNKDEHC